MRLLPPLASFVALFVAACGSEHAQESPLVEASESNLGATSCSFVPQTDVYGTNQVYYRVFCKCGWVGTLDYCSTMAAVVPDPLSSCLEGLDARCGDLIEKGPTDGMCTWMATWGDGSWPSPPQHCICKSRYASPDGLKYDLGDCGDPSEDGYDDCRARLEDECVGRFPSSW